MLKEGYAETATSAIEEQMDTFSKTIDLDNNIIAMNVKIMTIISQLAFRLCILSSILTLKNDHFVKIKLIFQG